MRAVLAVLVLFVAASVGRPEFPPQAPFPPQSPHEYCKDPPKPKPAPVVEEDDNGWRQIAPGLWQRRPIYVPPAAQLYQMTYPQAPPIYMPTMYRGGFSGGFSGGGGRGGGGGC